MPVLEFEEWSEAGRTAFEENALRTFWCKIYLSTLISDVVHELYSNLFNCTWIWSTSTSFDATFLERKHEMPAEIVHDVLVAAMWSSFVYSFHNLKVLINTACMLTWSSACVVSGQKKKRTIAVIAVLLLLYLVSGREKRGTRTCHATRWPSDSLKQVLLTLKIELFRYAFHTDGTDRDWQIRILYFSVLSVKRTVNCTTEPNRRGFRDNYIIVHNDNRYYKLHPPSIWHCLGKMG